MDITYKVVNVGEGPFEFHRSYCCKVSLVMLEGTSSCQHVRRLPDGSYPTPQEPCGLRYSTTVSLVVHILLWEMSTCEGEEVLKI
jgi:hypothetical protein